MRDDIIALHAECMHFMAMQYTKRLCCGVALAICGVVYAPYQLVVGGVFLLSGGILALSSGRKTLLCLAASSLMRPGQHYDQQVEQRFLACVKLALGKRNLD